MRTDVEKQSQKSQINFKLIQIGNSRGVRLPKELIEQAGLKDEIDLIARDGEILIANTHSPREGWEASFAAMSQRGDDKLAVPDVFTEEVLEEWSGQ
jgi:antitoxin MazE